MYDENWIAEQCREPPPKPTMAEIEMRVDLLIEACYRADISSELASRAALMAAIRQLSNSTQDSE